MANPGVEFAQVNFEAGAATDGSRRRLLKDVSLSVAAGTTTALLGRSGSGKTTLLRTVNALVRPSSGRVLVGGVDVATTDRSLCGEASGTSSRRRGCFRR